MAAKQPAKKPAARKHETSTPAAVQPDSKPPGTATKKLIPIKMEGPLAALASLATKKSYMGCSGCQANLETFVEQNPGIDIFDIGTCPHCNATFIVEDRRSCYCCSTVLPDTGKCVSCGASSTDDEKAKVLVIYIRRQNPNTKGRVARMQAQGYMGDEVFVTQTLALARKEGWVSDWEKASSSPRGNTAGGMGASSRNF